MPVSLTAIVGLPTVAQVRVAAAASRTVPQKSTGTDGVRFSKADCAEFTMPKTLYLVDGYYQAYRAFFGSLRQPLSSRTGEPTGATHVFCMMLLNLIRDRRPDYLAMAMDVSDETVFRRDIDPQYKATRDPTPEDLHTQIERIVSIVETLGIPILRVPGFEADDLMATIAERLRDEDVRLYLVSRDKDLEQLLTDRVHMYDPMKGSEIDPTVLLETKGYTPEQALEVQTLVGDSTDNIPGIHGVGPKTAVKLIGQYGTAEAVVEHADELTPRMAQSVKAFAEQLPVTRQLVTLRRDVPFSFDLAACRLDDLRIADVQPIFDELGFTTVREALDNLFDSKPPQDASSVTPSVAAAPASRGTYTLVDDEQKLDALAETLSRLDRFAFDTETTGLNPVDARLVGLSFSWQSGEACYVPVLAAVGAVVPEASVVEKLGPVFANADIAKVGHNLKYDVVVLKQVGIETEGVAFDTMIASFLLDPTRRSHGLDALASALFGHDMIPITDLIGKGKNQTSLDHLDTERVGEYAAEDADFTWRLYEHFAPQMSGSFVEPLFRDTEMPLVEVLATMEHNGIALDVPLLAKIGASMTERLDELRTQVHEAAGRAFNLDSPKQLAEVLFDEQGFTPIRKTKTGQSTDADTLASLASQQNNPIPRLVLEYRELAKLKGTYVDTLPTMVCKRTNRIHAGFHQTGAITGRLSSSDPNLQNIPIRTEAGRQIREAIVSGREDSWLLSADYSQIELRLLAHFCKDKALVEAFASGQDIHRTVAAQVNGVSLEEVTSEQRSAAKAVNFGIIYGQTPFGLARALGIPVPEAKVFIDTYFMRYPGIRLFVDKCIDDAKRKGFTETVLGRRRPVPELQSRNRTLQSAGERIAVNTVVQGSAADLIKRAMIDIHRELRKGAYRARMLVQVHDELVFEVAKDDTEAMADMVRERMERAIELDVPVVVDLAWGRSWAEAK